MDAPDEELDVKLQRASPELLADFETSLRPFLRRVLPNGELRIRKKVRTRETDRLINLLSPHQENPQLLDPHLEKFLRLLSDAFLEYLKSVKPSRKHSTENALLIPLSEAVCKLLYTFSKIRGEKVIVRFFNAEPKNLELLLSAIESADDVAAPGDHATGADTSKTGAWSWEERYVTILWLSHLLLNPFDLASISSSEITLCGKLSVPRLMWPLGLPGIAWRVVPLAIKYLASAGKERDAAKALLVRISMRKDMLELGLLQALIEWALSCLHSSAVGHDYSPYYFIGILSYLGGILVSSMNTSDMDRYLKNIFDTVQAVSDPENVIFKTIHTSALARKTVIKVMRSIVVLVLRPTYYHPENKELVEMSIGHMMEALADNDTPVRLAASKALSIITLKLPSEPAAQVVDAVLSQLNENVLWVDSVVNDEYHRDRDLSRVNPLEWHGLILTLSHLLYRHSPPAQTLSLILHALMVGLTFEQRSTSGTSIGTNVRDAACFGIWAVARRYSTDELRSVNISTVDPILHSEVLGTSMIQVLAAQLTVSASLDPAGNIRRGASAALQELIGRHPDTVANGIDVVQVVDYHAVARRSRAMLEVAPQAALLSHHYESAMVNGLLDWRGAGDADPAARRTAAVGIGHLVKGLGRDFTSKPSRTEAFELQVLTTADPRLEPWSKASSLLKYIDARLKGLTAREVDLTHGLLLSLSAVISSLPRLIRKEDYNTDQSNSDAPIDNYTDKIALVITLVLDSSIEFIESSSRSVTRKPELRAEGMCCLVSAICPVLWAGLSYSEWMREWRRNYPTGAGEKRPSEFFANRFSLEQWRSSIEDCAVLENPIIRGFGRTLNQDLQGPGDVRRNKQFEAISKCVAVWIVSDEKAALEAVTDAAVDLLRICAPIHCRELVKSWLSSASAVTPSLLFTLTKAFPLIDQSQRLEVCDVIQNSWQRAKNVVESRVLILESITSDIVFKSSTNQFLSMLFEGLDDYTTDGRGDIGSLVRIAALKVARGQIQSIPWESFGKRSIAFDNWFMDLGYFTSLLGKVLRLAGEKLDKVRAEARMCLAQFCCDASEHAFLTSTSTSSSEYFTSLLELQTTNWLKIPSTQYRPYMWRLDVFEGLVSSADAGSEDLIRASRASLIHFCRGSKRSDDHGTTGYSTDERINYAATALFDLAKKHESNDRVLVPTLEVISFLFDMGIMQNSDISWKALFVLVQKAHYKSTNMRKLDACVRLYGGLIQVHPEAMEKLTSMLLHPYLQIRNRVVDVIFVTTGVGKGVNWLRAKKEEVMVLKAQMNVLKETKKIPAV